MGATLQPVPRSTSTSDEAAVLLELPGDSLMVKVPPPQEQQPAPAAEPVSSMQQPQVEAQHPVQQQEVEQMPPVQRQKVGEPVMAMRLGKGEGSTQAGGADGNRPEGAPPVPAQAAPHLQCGIQKCIQGRMNAQVRVAHMRCVHSTMPCCPWRKAVQLKALLHSCNAPMLAAKLRK